MQHALPPPGRRAVLFGAVALVGIARPATAAVPDSATLLVPGPEDSAQVRWAARLAATMGRGLPQATRLHLALLGGPDGVTAANRFATAAAPDGRTLLVLPGAAAQARLIGDPRAKYEPAGWLPVCASAAPAALVSRLPLLARRGGAATAPLRVAIPGPEAPESAAVMALDLLGVPVLAVPGVPRGAAAEAALAQGAVDAAVVAGGADLPARTQALGARPLFALDPIGGGREPLLPDTPTAGEILSATLVAAAPAAGCRAGLAAARLGAALVLPALTPSDTVASWRHAAQRWQEETVAGAPRGATGSVAGADAAGTLAELAPPPDAVLAYREWLMRRLDWRAV
jgi:hypothetical protein